MLVCIVYLCSFMDTLSGHVRSAGTLFISATLQQTPVFVKSA